MLLAHTVLPGATASDAGLSDVMGGELLLDHLESRRLTRTASVVKVNPGV